MLPALLDPTNDSNSLWGDSAFAGLTYRAFLETAGYQSHIHEKVHVITPYPWMLKQGIA